VIFLEGISLNKKRLAVSLLTVIIVASTIFPNFIFADVSEQPLVAVRLTMYSNLSDKDYITGFYRDNKFFISLDNIADITGVKILHVTDEIVMLHANGMRHFEIFLGNYNENLMRESFLNGGSHYVLMPSLVIDGNIYISTRNFLKYIGAYFSFNENSYIQFMVAARYNIFNVFAEYERYNDFFRWTEIGYTARDIERQIIQSGLISFFARDSNFLRWIVNPRGIEHEIVQDVLVAILTNEGERYFHDGNKPSDFLKLLNDMYKTQEDVIKFITSAYTSDLTAEFATQLNALAESAGLVVSVASDAVSAIETMRQIGRITEMQRTLLENTILRYWQDSPMLVGDWDVVLSVAQNVNERVQVEHANNHYMMVGLATRTAYDMLNRAVSVGNPVTKALTYVSIISRGLGLTEGYVQFFNASYAYIIQVMANQLFSYAWNRLVNEDFFYWSPSDQLIYLNRMRYALILQLKATLTTREYLAMSGHLSIEQSIEMLETNVQIAEYLNRVTNAQMTFVGSVMGFREEYAENISWLSDFEITSRYAYYEAIEAYMEFLRQRGFESYIDIHTIGNDGGRWTHLLMPPRVYSIVDIDGDGIPELIIRSVFGDFNDSLNVYSDWIFRYDTLSREVAFLAHLGTTIESLYYCRQYNLLVITHNIGHGENPFFSDFMTLQDIEDNTEINSFSLTKDTTFGNHNFYIWSEGLERRISEEEFQKHFDGLTKIEFYPIPRVQATNFDEHFVNNPIDALENRHSRYWATTLEMTDGTSHYARIWENEIIWAYSRLIELSSGEQQIRYMQQKEVFIATHENEVARLLDEFVPSGGTIDRIERAIIVRSFYRRVAEEVYRILFDYDSLFKFYVEVREQ